MTVSVLVWLCVLLLATGLAIGLLTPLAVANNASSVSSSANATTGPSLDIVYPNPVARGDPGEYITLTFPTPTNVTGWTITDRTGRAVSLPNRTVNGTITVSTTPDAVPSHAPSPILPLTGWVQFANSGDAVVLRSATGTQVASVRYDRAPEGELYTHTTEWTWQPLGATNFDAMPANETPVTAFLLPDHSTRLLDHLDDADNRLLIAGYTLTSTQVVSTLIRAHQRGVDVAVLLEGSPIGGMSQQQVTALDRLTQAGVPVTVFGGPRDPYATHHPKYAVIDDQALVLTENWKPAGIGGHSSRGWAVHVADATTAAALARTFAADQTGPGRQPWKQYRTTVSPVSAPTANTTFPTRFQPVHSTASRTTVLMTPDNAGNRLQSLLADAETSIRIQQVSIARNTQLLNASLSAARRGVDVDILLSSTYYVASENRQLAQSLRTQAEKEQLDLTVELVSPRSRFTKVHAKGIIVDKTHVVVGSLNWNPTAVNDNREVMVQINDSTIATYYTKAFNADRHGGRWLLPYTVAGAVLIVWSSVGMWLSRRLQWASVSQS